MKTERRAFFFKFCVFLVMAAGFVFSVAVGRMHCACRDKRGEDRRGGGGGADTGNRKEEEVSGAQRSGQS